MHGDGPASHPSPIQSHVQCPWDCLQHHHDPYQDKEERSVRIYLLHKCRVSSFCTLKKGSFWTKMWSCYSQDTSCNRMEGTESQERSCLSKVYILLWEVGIFLILWGFVRLHCLLQLLLLIFPAYLIFISIFLLGFFKSCLYPGIKNCLSCSQRRLFFFLSSCPLTLFHILFNSLPFLFFCLSVAYSLSLCCVLSLYGDRFLTC